MLAFEDYLSEVKVLPFGKRVGKNAYVLWPDLEEASPLLAGILKPIAKPSETTLIKFFLDTYKVSFLEYPDFFTDPHPTLKASETVNLTTGQRRRIDYSRNDNPPILHRKETMISPARAEYTAWIKLTKQLEEAGCYEETKRIGFKQYWDHLLQSKGLAYNGHRLYSCDTIEVSEEVEDSIDRHKTAMTRSDFSRPIQLLLKHNLLEKERNFLDYGCGYGDDVRGLSYNGYNAQGWDPVYYADKEPQEADVVNLGFVLNVIEDPIERLQVLEKSYSLASHVLSVAVVTDTSPTAKDIRPYKDGYLTSRGTFQKYFRHEEIQEIIEETLNASAHPASQGVFFIFKKEQDAQDFLSAKQKRRIDWNKLNLHVYPSKDERDAAKKEILYAQHKDALEAYWEQMIDLGRAPTVEEYPEIKKLKNVTGLNPRKLQEWFIERYGQKTLEDSYNSRRADLLVYLGLANFKKKIPYSGLSTRLQRDMKTFFGSYKDAKKEALTELYKIGNPDEIEARCAKVFEEKQLGRLDEQALYFESNFLDDLDPVLRMYVGVAGMLYGDTDDVDVVKIHKRSGKVTFLLYDDYEEHGEENLHWRIKVDLPNQRVYFFDHQRN